MEKGVVRLGVNREENSPERGRATSREVAFTVAPPMRRVMRVLKKVQVVYYLTRNGQLEHPHFMEVSHLANQQLRLKDFIDRLIVLRGKGMPCRYSWSCKRSYKNGYVWNDLTENDIIHTSEGAEYILKGSEIVHSSTETERIQQLQISDKRPQTIYTNPIPKLKMNSLPTMEPKTPPKVEVEVEEVDECYEKASYTSSNAPFITGLTRKSSDHLSPQSTTSTLSSEKGEKVDKSREPSRRFVVVEEDEEEIDSMSEMTQGRNSVLLQLISCGGSVTAKGKSIPCLKQQMSRVEGRVVGGLQRGVVCKAAAMAARKVVVVGEEEEMIKYMSENPRFGNLQSEEKEYFSGSILEAMDDQRSGKLEPVLKKSSSYKEERNFKANGLGEGAAETGDKDDHKVEKAAFSCGGGDGKSKCIPNPMRKHQKQSKK